MSYMFALSFVLFTGTSVAAVGGMRPGPPELPGAPSAEAKAVSEVDERLGEEHEEETEAVPDEFYVESPQRLGTNGRRWADCIRPKFRAKQSRAESSKKTKDPHRRRRTQGLRPATKKRPWSDGTKPFGAAESIERVPVGTLKRLASSSGSGPTTSGSNAAPVPDEDSDSQLDEDSDFSSLVQLPSWLRNICGKRKRKEKKSQDLAPPNGAEYFVGPRNKRRRHETAPPNQAQTELGSCIAGEESGEASDPSCGYPCWRCPSCGILVGSCCPRGKCPVCV